MNDLSGKVSWLIHLGKTTTSKEEILAGRNFGEIAHPPNPMHFGGIYFGGLRKNINLAGIYFGS